ncbi:hypothetical protein SDC9_103677 [bioreactor metagenome]|uniref:Uncharacterized protein n=1 Tax=bioreactor metagenome TaxID=1076179 RepID=A0A645AX30_9ZZZZ
MAEIFQQSHPLRHRQPAVNLSFRQHRVDRAAHVMAAYHPDYLDASCVKIHLHLCSMAGIGIGVKRLPVPLLLVPVQLRHHIGTNRDRCFTEVIADLRRLSKGNVNIRKANAILRKDDVVGRFSKLSRQCPRHNRMYFVARVLERASAKECAARGNTGAGRGRARGVRISKADTFKRHAHPFGNHLALAGAKPLPKLGQPKIDVYAAVFQHFDKCAGNVKAVSVRADACTAHAHRDAYATADTPSVPVLSAVTRIFLVKSQLCRRFLHNRADADLMEIQQMSAGADIAVLQQILAPQFRWRQV